MNPDEPYTIKLRRPIKWGSEVKTQIILQPLEAHHLDDIQDLQKIGPKDIVSAAAAASGEPLPLIRRIGGADFVEVAQWLGESFGDGLPTGADSSES